MSISSSYPNQGLVVLGTGPSSGINYTTILNAYEQSLSEPITLMQQQETPLNNQLSAWQNINGDVTSLNDMASALGKPSLLQTYTASSSNTSVATATVSSSAIPGTYALSVTSLATAGITASQGVASTSANVGTGTFSITVNGTTTNINITSSNDTLSGLAQAINNSSSAAGVTASIINNGGSTNPYQLVLTSNNTGTNDAITSSGVTDSLTGGTALTFTTTVAATNAALTYGGINIASQSNTVTNVIPGVTLNLLSAGSTNITVGLNTQAVDSSVSGFVTAYNQLISDVSAQNQYSSTTKSLGPLGGNAALSGLVNSLYGFMGSEAPTLSGNAGLPSTYGITSNSDGSGKLSLNTSTLNSMLNTNPSQVQQFFSALVNGSSSANGVSEPGGLTNYLSTYTNPANGIIQFSSSQINTQLTNMNNQIARMQANVQSQMGMYTKEFSSLESYIGQMQTTNASLTNDIKQLPTW